jgi:hypothetical protein
MGFDMKSTRWFELNAEELSPEVHPLDAPWATERPSPYSVPSHARASYEAASGCLIIELRYFENEDVEAVVLDRYVTVDVGKRSHRVRRIKFDAHSFSRDRTKIAAEADRAISGADETKVSNRDIAARAIGRNRRAERMLDEALA